jgi:integration host factor beta subunit
MTKSELVDHVAERLPYVTRQDAEVIVDTIFDSMAGALAEGDRVEIRGFGSLRVKNLGARVGRNPRTGEPVHVPAKKLPFFKIGKDLYERINRTVPSTGSVER